MLTREVSTGHFHFSLAGKNGIAPVEATEFTSYKSILIFISYQLMATIALSLLQ